MSRKQPTTPPSPSTKPPPPPPDPVPCLTEHRAACPRCKGFNQRVTNTARFPNRTMMMPDGSMHRGIRLQRRVCKSCHRVFNVRLPLIDEQGSAEQPSAEQPSAEQPSAELKTEN